MFMLGDCDIQALVLSVLLTHVDRQLCPLLMQLRTSGKRA